MLFDAAIKDAVVSFIGFNNGQEFVYISYFVSISIFAVRELEITPAFNMLPNSFCPLQPYLGS